MRFTLHASRFTPLLCLLALAACGFRPIHATGGASGAADPAAIGCRLEIAPIAGGRPAQLLEIGLREAACGGMPPSGPADYRLQVEYGEAIIPIIIERDATIVRYAVQIEAVYTLRPIDGGKPLTGSRLRRRVSYNAHQSDYATTIAERDAREQTVRAMARDIVARLQAWQARNS